MGSGGTLPLRTGKYTSDGTARTVHTPGFTPKRVTFINETTGARAVHTDTMPADSVATTDSGVDAFATSNGVTLDDEGFEAGTNAVLNTDNDVIHWVAEA